jgi:hypothetical protein
LQIRRCEHEGCCQPAYYATFSLLPGDDVTSNKPPTPTRCGEHKRAGDRNTSFKVCDEMGCDSRAYYGSPSSTRKASVCTGRLFFLSGLFFAGAISPKL